MLTRGFRFVIAMRKAGGGWKTVSTHFTQPHSRRSFNNMAPQVAVIVNVGFISSAWSAASSDVYISSRYLFFLARCHHAPEFCGRLFHRRATAPAAFASTPSPITPEATSTTPAGDVAPDVADRSASVPHTGLSQLPPFSPPDAAYLRCAGCVRLTYIRLRCD